MKDYTKDEFGERFPEKERHILDRMTGLLYGIQTDLASEKIDDAQHKIAEVLHWTEKLQHS